MPKGELKKSVKNLTRNLILAGVLLVAAIGFVSVKLETGLVSILIVFVLSMLMLTAIATLENILMKLIERDGASQ